MPNLFLILVIAFVLIVFTIAFLAMGWLITGKKRIQTPSGGDLAKQQEGQLQNKPSIEKEESQP